MALAPIPISGRALTPDITGGIQRGQQINVLEAQQAALQGQEARAQQEAQQLAQQQQSARQLSQQSVQGQPIETGQQLAQLFVDNPDLAKNVRDSAGIRTEFQLNDAADFGFQLEHAGDVNRENQLIEQRIQKVTARGGDPKDTIALRQADPMRRAQFARTIQLAALNNAERLEIAQGEREAAAGTGISQVQSSTILPGGLVQLVRKDGTVEVKQPDQANIDLIKAAEDRGAELQGLRAGERQAGKKAIDIGIDSFKTLATTRKNIANMDEGIALLKGGARTGVVEGRLPSVRAASLKLDNLRGRLGLDVVSSVTFGALSESELAFAINTALPTGLDETDLLGWMQEKRDAQAKLATNLEEAALFLGTPGNTVAEFIRLKKQQRAEKEAGGLADLTLEDLSKLSDAELQALSQGGQ